MITSIYVSRFVIRPRRCATLLIKGVNTVEVRRVSLSTRPGVPATQTWSGAFPMRRSVVVEVATLGRGAAQRLSSVGLMIQTLDSVCSYMFAFKRQAASPPLASLTITITLGRSGSGRIWRISHNRTPRACADWHWHSNRKPESDAL